MTPIKYGKTSMPQQHLKTGRHLKKARLSRRQVLLGGLLALLPVGAAASVIVSNDSKPSTGKNGIGPSTPTTSAPPVFSNATVDLATRSRSVDPTAAGICCSTFGKLATDPVQGAAEKALGVRYFRIPVRLVNSSIVSSALGANNLALEPTIATYYSWPGVRMELVIAGEETDWDGYRAGDAAGIVNRLKIIGCTDLSRFDFSGPNEPDNAQHSLNDVISRDQEISAELRTAGQDGKVFGPVWSNPNGDFATFAKTMGSNGLAGIDWHYYPGASGLAERSIQQVYGDVRTSCATDVAAVRGLLSDAGLSAAVSVDEFNWSYEQTTSTLYTSANTVLMALGYCTVLQQGGRMLAYATQNGGLSVLCDAGNPQGRPQSSPMPAYWGIATLTGGDLFSHYKDSFYSCTSAHEDVSVFAVNNEAGGYNLILINISETETVPVSLRVAGFSGGSYDLWQSSPAYPYDPPRKTVSAAATTPVLKITQAPLSVSVVVLART
jgi:hypothetical protein